MASVLATSYRIQWGLRSDRGEIVEPSGRRRNQGGECVVWLPECSGITPSPNLSPRPQELAFAKATESVILLLLPVPLTTKLRVAGAETHHMPFYLRIFFRVLSSWGALTNGTTCRLR
jgi:hypothetical protein